MRSSSSRSSKPPALATWILERLGSDPRNDSIIGDLIEQYGEGRSRYWYWRQVTVVILSSFFREISSHKFLALRALATGWFVWWILNRALVGLEASLNPWNAKLPLIPSLLWLAWLTNRALSGWIVARFHRANRVAMVLLFSFSVFLWKAQIVQWPLYVDLLWPFHLGLNALHDPRYVPGLFAMALAPISVLLGALILDKLHTDRPFNACPIEFAHTRADFWRAKWLHVGKGGGWRRVLKIGFVMAAFVCAIVVIAAHARLGQAPAWLVPLTLGAFVFFLTRTVRPRQHYYGPLRIYFSEEGFHVVDPASQSRRRWNELAGYLEDRHVYLLYLNPRLYRIVPKRALGHRLENFGRLVQTALPPFDYRRRFPVADAARI